MQIEPEIDFGLLVLESALSFCAPIQHKAPARWTFAETDTEISMLLGKNGGG